MRGVGIDPLPICFGLLFLLYLLSPRVSSLHVIAENTIFLLFRIECNIFLLVEFVALIDWNSLETRMSFGIITEYTHGDI